MVLTTRQREVIEELSKTFGENITLKELLETKDSTPIEDVIFDINGTYVYVYELTGQQRNLNGTIKDILDELTGFEIFVDTGDNLEEGKLSEVITDDELTELAKFFLGERKDRCLDNVSVNISRPVTLEEVRKYLGNLDVWTGFEYKSTLIDF